MTSDEAIEMAAGKFQAGEILDAAALCEAVLSDFPDEHRALRLLGGVRFRQRRLDEAESLLRRAVALSPRSLEYLDNLCVVLNAAGKFSESEQWARQTLRLDPTFAPAASILGSALREQGRLDEAAGAFRHALSLDQTLLHPLNNLSNVLRMLGQPGESENTCRHALALYPDVAELWVNLGAALHDQRRHAEAIAAFDRALELQPRQALAAFNRGIALEALDRLSAAEQSYRLALAIQPELLMALNNLGVVLKSQGRLPEALACFRNTLAQKSDYMVAHTNLLITLLSSPEIPPETLLAEHRAWDRSWARLPACQEKSESDDAGRQAECLSHFSLPLASRGTARTAPLRVGFVSPDLGQHPVGRFLIAGFERLDPRRIATVCYSDRRFPDEVTDRFRSAAREWRETRMLSDQELEECLRADELDLLIDLTGHTGQHRLRVFARRPVARQATWLGYAGTTGLSAIDWIIADPTLIPPGHERFYSETVARMPVCHGCLERPEFDVPVVEPPCFRTGHITFGSFNKPDKTNPAVIDVWAAILQAVPGSRLLLRNRGLDDEPTANRFRRLFEERGIEASRIELAGWTTHEQLLAEWNRIDIGLDTFPFSGGATSADALWMGVPLVTLAGPTFASRQTASLLTAIGETSTIATDRGSYLRTAVTLASDRSRLRDLRLTLRERMEASPLMDSDRFAADLTRLFESLVAN